MLMKPLIYARLTAALFALTAVLSCQKDHGSMDTEQAATNTEQPVDLVYPLLDTVNSRWFYFDSASRPFGMVNLSPDTEMDGTWGSGYRYNSEEVQGFSHVHAWQLSGLSVMPVSDSRDLEALSSDYFSPFSHDNEEVRPGYHSVKLDRYDIDAELTATTRVGFHRYQFSDAAAKHVLFKLSGKLGPVELSDAKLEQIDDFSVAGYVENKETIRRPKATPVFFHVQFNQRIANIDTLQDSNGALSFARIGFPEAEEPSLLMKVGISYTSESGAKQNLETELPHWDFDRIAQEAYDEWNSWLSNITVQGGSLEQRKRFYTDLWHALQGRRILSDANGLYSDQTGSTRQVKQLPLDANGKPLFNHHNSDSFWGAQWTITPLWAIAYPQVASNFTNSLLQYYRDGGLIPRGPSGGNYTYVMTGASSTPFIVNTWMSGIRDFDEQLAWEGMVKNHSERGMMSRAGYEHDTNVGGGMKYYLERNYIPYPIPEDVPDPGEYHFHWKGAGQTIEYSFQDASLAAFARNLGHENEAQYYQERSKNYLNVFDPESGFARPRTMDGNWQIDYDPYEYQTGFVESNAAQMTWYPVHDIDGLAEFMGGKAALVEKLDKEFLKASELGFTSGKAHADETKERYSRIPINYGNQPSMQSAFIFAAAGVPQKTQYWSREVIKHAFSGLDPESGYNGDEDQGFMGSLAVLMKIGLFQLNTGMEEDPVYWLGSPIFDEITISLDKTYYAGDTFKIIANNNSESNRFIKSAKLNGEPLNRPYILHSEIVSGGILELEMSDKMTTK